MPPTPASTRKNPAPIVVTIGNFDGVHLGHQALLRAARTRADSPGDRGNAGRVIAAVFAKHPAAILRDTPLAPPITPSDARAELLLHHGADEVVAIDPTRELLAMAPEAFLESFFDEHRPDAIVEGDDFRFGANRAGDASTLRSFCRRRGVDPIIVEQVDVGLTDQLVVRASSTITRWLLERGRVGDAAIVLGRPHRLAGRVVRGDRRGREIGFPTANLDCPALFPADGIYAGIATLDDGRRWPAAISVGTKPTFNGVHRVVEAYLCGWDGPQGDEYGWGCALDCIAWVRGQIRFASIASLVEQIERDVDQILRRLDTLSGSPQFTTPMPKALT